MSICARLGQGVEVPTHGAMQEVAASLAEELPANVALGLSGPMGVGKTTFVQGLAKALGIDQPVTSPTFAIMSTYTGSRRLLHLDLYRLTRAEELDALMLEDFLVSPCLLCIEWPERWRGPWPLPYRELALSPLANGLRRVQWVEP